MLDFWTTQSQKDFDLVRSSTRVIARIPTEVSCTATGCGWDPVAQSALNMECATCKGKGKVQTWVPYQIECRVMWSSMVKFAYVFPSPGVELGDCVITTALEFANILDLVMGNERAYILADDKIVRPTSRQEQTVGNIVKEYEYVCHYFTPNPD